MSGRVEKSAEEVAAQREFKKSEDAIRKLESALKKQAEGTPERATTLAEIDRLNARIAELSEQFGFAGKSAKKAAGAPPKQAGPTITDASAPTAAASPTTVDAPAMPTEAEGNAATTRSVHTVESSTGVPAIGARPDPARLKEELELCKAKLLQMGNNDQEQMEELRARMATLVDICISLTTEQASLATARASPAVVPRQSMTPALSATLTTAAQLPPIDLPASSSVSAVLPPTPLTALGAVNGNSNAAATSNLPTCRSTIDANTESDMIVDGVHPRFASLAVHTRMMQIVGGNARALALVDAILAFIRSTKTLSEDIKSLGPREKNVFLRQFNVNINAVRNGRLLCQSMQYVVDAFTARFGVAEYSVQEKYFVRDQVAATAADVGDTLLQCIRKLSERTQEVSDDDTVLVFGRSSSVEMLLLNVAAGIKRREAEASEARRAAEMRRQNGCGQNQSAPEGFTTVAPNRLRVIVLDSAPLFEGRGLARRLQAQGVAVRYALASAASQLMPLCTKVFLGSSAVMQSGDVVGRCGTAMVAACAKNAQKPVFFFAEDHKLTREVWIGSLTRNEQVHSGFHPLAGQTAFQQKLFAQDGAPSGSSAPPPPNGYLYDVTPSSFIDVIVTRLGRIHPTAVCSLIMPDTEEEAARLEKHGDSRGEGGDDEGDDEESYDSQELEFNDSDEGEA